MPDPAPRERLRPLLLVLIASTAVSMINPNGPTILLYALGTQTSGAQQSLIEEWFSPSFHDWEVLVYGAMLLSLAMLTVFNRHIRARDVALVLVTTALSLQSARHIALFVAASTPVYIDQLALATPRMRAAMRRLRRAPAPARTRARVQPPLLFRLTACALLIAGLGGVYVAWLVPKMQLQPYSLAYAQEFPVCAAQWLAGAPEPLKIFNQYGEGGYLAYALSPHGDKVFIFGDAALMGDPLLYTYADVETVTPGWDSIIRAAGTDIVLYDINTPLADVMAHAADWTKVYQDGLSVAFVPTDKLSTRAAPARAPLAAGQRLRAAGEGCAECRSAEPVKRPDLLVIAGAEQRTPRDRRAGSRGSPRAAIVVLVLTVQPFSDTDVWWHLALGRLITTSGIPAHEPFSFLPAAHAWVGQQWLYEVTLAGLVGAGGAGLASLVMGLAAVAAVVHRRALDAADPRASPVRGSRSRW